jgi:cell volume regulation protein A
MDTASIFGLPAALLVLAFIANRLSKLTRVPDLIVLLLIGIMLGPVLHWVHREMFKDAIHILGMLALTLILFEGGLELRLRQALRYFPAGVLLVVTSFGLSMGLIALIGRALLHLSWLDCLLMGAALGCTSGTIVIPALQQISAPEAVKTTLTIEAALGEVIAVLIVGSMLNTVPNQSVVSGIALDFSQNIAVAVIIGFVAGLIWSRLWPLAAPQPYSNVLNLGIVLGVYAVTRLAGGSSLLGELVFGITLANMPLTPHAMRQGVRMLAFHSELSFLVRSFFFVMLGVVAEFVGHAYLIPILGILAAIVLARFLAAQLTRFVVRGATRREAELLFWMLPRGLVTAVLALEVVAVRGAVFTFLPAVAFTVVLVSNLFIICGAIRSGQAPPVSQIPTDKALAAEEFKSAAAGSAAAATPATTRQ